MSDNKIILIQDLVENKERKEKELQYYKDRLQFLEQRVSVLQSEIDLTNTIIQMIDEENIVEVPK